MAIILRISTSRNMTTKFITAQVTQIWMRLVPPKQSDASNFIENGEVTR